MRLERRAARVSLVEVERIAVVRVARDAVLECPRLGGCQTGYFGVDSL